MSDKEITRTLPFTLERAETDDDGLTMIGYAAVFNQPTRINSWEGHFDEVIRPGAFRASLEQRTPVLMFEHGHHPLIGSLPIGRFTDIREDDHGLRVEARLHNNWLTQPIRDAISEGSVTGMSFRFLGDQTDDDWTERKGDVPLREIRSTVVPEAGPVVFPAYVGTEVAVRMLEQKANELVVDRVVSSGAKAAADNLKELEGAEREDLTGQSGARSSDGGDAVTTDQLARKRALQIRRII